MSREARTPREGRRPTARATATDREKEEPERRQRNVMIRVQQAIEPLASKIRRVLPYQLRVVVMGVAEQNPADVRPEAAVARAVRIAFQIRQLMVLAVRGHPENRAAFERQRAAEREEVLERLRGLESAMRVKSVVAEADTEPHGEPVQGNRDREVRPGKGPERRDGEHMESTHEARGDPIEGGE